MNFEIMPDQLSQIKEIAVIGRNAEIDGVICHIMGMVLRDDHILQMLILQYDERYQEKLEAEEIAELTRCHEELITNRIEQQRVREPFPVPDFCDVERVCIGGLELVSSQSSGSMCSTKQWDTTAVFTQFLLSGWNPAGIDTKDIDIMFLTDLTFDGVYDAIPAFDKKASIRFSMRKNHTCHPVELPLTLAIGSEYPNKLYFSNKLSGERHWTQINKVSLYDMWAEMSKTFDDSQMNEHFSPEERAQRKAEFEEHFSEMCPKGMCYPFIEYECEEGISLQFYSKQWLDAEARHSSRAMVFIMEADKPTGKLGLKMKTAIIKEPTPANTDLVEVELFKYYQTSKSDDIVMS